MPTRYTMSQRFASVRVVAAVAVLSPVPAFAADLLGFYAGAAVGHADVRANQGAFAVGTQPGTPLGFNEHATGWKVLVGIRPISLIGAELGYADFGHPSAHPLNSLPFDTTADAHPRATTLSGLLYAPIPAPLLDLYGRVGVSRLRSDVHAIAGCCSLVPIPPFALSETTTEFAYGAGAQLKFSALAVRLEYERVNASGGDQDLLSIGLNWTF